MGKYKFRFSDMIPNAWFHKLKDMSRSSSSSSSKPRSKSLNPTNNNKHYSLPSHINSNNSDQRKSYYISRDLSSQPSHSPTAEPPPRRRRSTKRNRPRPPPPPQLVSTCSCRATVESVSPPSPEESGPDQSSSSEPDSVITEYGSGRGSAADSMASWSSPCKCGNKNDIIIDIDNSGAGEDHCRRRRLAPIITKNSDALTIKVVKEDTMARRVPARSPGMRLRVNSPRIGNRRIQGRKSVSSSRRSISDSLAVVKASKDPRRDFRESMVEMIMENNIKASKDLEELLACYLSLNSEEYHDLIINVFKQIWFDFFHLRLN